MGTQHPSVPPRAQSRIAADKDPNRGHHTGGLVHDNTRHTTRFTVIGNHLAQHRELSLLAIGLGVHLQSLPKGARVDIKTLTVRFPEGATRIAAALRELEAHGYLRRPRERAPGGRIVTRTISCNQPPAGRRHHDEPPHTAPDAPDRPATAAPKQEQCEKQAARETGGAHEKRAARKPLPAVPRPAYPAPALLQAATDLLADLRRRDPRLLLSACDTAHLAPGVAAWLEREVGPAAVRHALPPAMRPARTSSTARTSPSATGRSRRTGCRAIGGTALRKPSPERAPGAVSEAPAPARGDAWGGSGAS
ncbi:helix-turn-helix domain-containing protein [Streptomyces sp. NPDC088816]|uniref:helix-turn-helix domain-containing protein n=1 Tax=Streptomyces sp. NPDC088816 TaxID=3365906 RepID=UPI00380EA568